MGPGLDQGVRASLTFTDFTEKMTILLVSTYVLGE